MTAATDEVRSGGRTGLTAGLRHLLRLALRRDRVRIPVWVLALSATAGFTVPALEATYGGTAGASARGSLVDNPAGVVMLGPGFGVTDPTLGAMTANELGMTLYVAAAVMGILLTVRHTRSEEEAGRVEVVRALAVGRFAPGAAALLVTFLATLGVAVGVAGALAGTGLPVADSLVFGVSVGLTGAAFAAVAAVTAQLASHARAATGLALAVLGVAFALRGVGDVLDPTDGSALSWFSPLAWAQQTRAYVDTRVWPLGLLLALTAGLVAVAAVLGVRRDLGAGLLPDRRAPERAGAGLSSAAGLAWRLLRGSVVGWALSLAAFAVAFGSLTETMNEAVRELPEMARWLALGPGALTDSYAAAMLLYLSLGTSAFVVTAVLALRGEEVAGSASLVIVTGPSRLRWMGTWLGVTTLGALLVQLLTGLALGAGVALSMGDGRRVVSLTVTALAYLPAVLLLGAVATALVGLWPGAARAATWTVFAYVLAVAILGPLLELPEAVLDLSPLQATPAMPAEEAEPGTIALLGGAALALAALGLAGFRRRDLDG